MQIQCPNCNNVCELDAEPALGQHIVCPFCSEKFSYSGSDEFPEGGDISATALQRKLFMRRGVARLYPVYLMNEFPFTALSG